MSNPYVLGGYLAAAVILGVYVVHLLRRARVLSRALGERADLLARTAPASPASPSPDHGPERS